MLGRGLYVFEKYKREISRFCSNMFINCHNIRKIILYVCQFVCGRERERVNRNGKIEHFYLMV